MGSVDGGIETTFGGVEGMGSGIELGAEMGSGSYSGSIVELGF